LPLGRRYRLGDLRQRVRPASRVDSTQSARRLCLMARLPLAVRLLLAGVVIVFAVVTLIRSATLVLRGDLSVGDTGPVFIATAAVVVGVAGYLIYYIVFRNPGRPPGTTLVCPGCGNQSMPGDRRCRNCGQPFKQPA
jgi:hypothetical protein